MWLNKYFQIIKISWQNTLVYRLSFLLWRLESIILFLTSYLFWLAVYKTNTSIANYTSANMFTYIIMILVLKNFIFGSKTNQVAEDIGTGSLNKYLLKPIQYFRYMYFWDIGDRISNVILLFFELIIIFFILKPPFFLQTDIYYLIFFTITIMLSMILYFYLSLIVSLTTFWYPEHNGWPQRFLFDTMMIFLTGGWFPLDILPKQIYTILEYLPTTYIRFFPLQIYLGKLSNIDLGRGLVIMAAWIFFCNYFLNLIWNKGLKKFTAVGI